MSTQRAFRAKIDGYLKATGMKPAAFGRAAVNDPNFVSDVRAGRAPSLRLVEKVDDYIEEHPAPAPQESESSGSPAAP